MSFLNQVIVNGYLSSVDTHESWIAISYQVGYSLVKIGFLNIPHIWSNTARWFHIREQERNQIQRRETLAAARNIATHLDRLREPKLWTTGLKSLNMFHNPVQRIVVDLDPELE
jgi:hypothetical protein